MTASLWTEFRRWRNWFFGWWAFWLPFGVLFNIIERWLFGTSESLPLWLPVLLWSGPWFYIAWRIRRLTCPKCGDRAFDHCFFYMENAKCRSCDCAYVNSDGQV